MNPYAKIILQELKGAASYFERWSQTMSENYEDKELICTDCKRPFSFTSGEQKYYETLEFTPPKRCKPCRDMRKAKRESKEE